MTRSEAATSVVSPALGAAQQRLLALRQQRQKARSVAEILDGRSPNTTHKNLAEAVATLPDHLGWESVRATAVCRSKSSHNVESADSSWWQKLAAERVETAVVAPSASQETLKLQPTLALALLRTGQVAVARIWVLLRHIDKTGQGWLGVTTAREQLCGKQSALRVCGWRQLRKLLAQGEGIFWQREGERLWLRSVSKVAAMLEIGRLQGKPVALPLSVLTQTIGTVRAHFYASFHSARDGKRPIARQTLQQLGGICRHTQRDYEKRAQVKKQRNFAIGPKPASLQAEAVAWQQGSACFELTDYHGHLGKPGISYLAWQLPNSYCGPHAQQSRSGQKRLNRKLVDLQEQGTAGNDWKAETKRYYSDGQLAAKAFNRGEKEIYWQERGGRWCWLSDGS